MTLDGHPARAFLGCCVDAPELGEVRGLGERSLVVVGQDGRILASIRQDGVELTALLTELQEAQIPVQELGEREFLLPGFIDTHIHLPQFPYTGTGIDKPLMADDGFLAKYAFPAERGMADVGQATATYTEGLDQLLRHGTTTALIYASAHLESSKALVDVAIRRGGPRCFVGKVCMDRHCPDGYVERTDQSLRDTEAFILYTQARAREGQAARPYLVQPVVTPRFIPTCSLELLRGLGDLAAKHDCMVQSHMSESCDEVAFSSSLFPGKSDAEVFSECGLLRPPSIMGHCVHLMPGEEDLLKRHGAAIAHCPLSNFFFAKEALPVKQLLQRGVHIGLGTDVAGGYSPSMLSALRAAVLASKTLQFRRAPGSALPGTDSGGPDEERRLREAHDLSHFDALFLATQGGASALGQGEALGSFDVGKTFDAVLLSARPTVPRYEGGVGERPGDVLQKILTLGDDRNVHEVYVGGACVRPAVSA